MATLTIPNLPDSVYQVLYQRALQHGLSIETEACQMLSNLCLGSKQPASNLQQLISKLYQDKTTGSQVEKSLAERRLEANNE